MKNIQQYLSQFTPSIDRSNSKYYSEMQTLAYNLIKYLSMNEDKDESQFQGNYNFTYLKENLTEEDYLFIINQMLKKIPMGKVRSMIKETWSDTANTVLYDVKESEDLLTEYNCLMEDYNFLKENHDKLKCKLETIQEIIDYREN